MHILCLSQCPELLVVVKKIFLIYFVLLFLVHLIHTFLKSGSWLGGGELMYKAQIKCICEY